MKASSRPSPPSVNYIINNGMNFLRASGSLPTPFSNHWKELFSTKTGTGEAVFLLSLSPHLLLPSNSRRQIQFSVSMPYTYSAQLLLLLNKDELRQLSDTCTTGILLGKAEVCFIILQRQHLRYATELLLQNACAEAQQGLHSPTPRPHFSSAQFLKLTKTRQQPLSQLE